MLTRTPIFRDPVFRSLASLASEFDRACAAPAVAGRAVRAGVPPINITSSESELVIQADVPGMTLEDLEIIVNGDDLTIRGERRFETPEGIAVLRQERSGGTFERTFTLPAEVDTPNARASLDLGVLTIVLPKTQAARPRRLEITGVGATPSGQPMRSEGGSTAAQN